MKCCKSAEWIQYIAIYLGLPSECQYMACRLTFDIFTKVASTCPYPKGIVLRFQEKLFLVLGRCPPRLRESTGVKYFRHLGLEKRAAAIFKTKWNPAAMFWGSAKMVFVVFWFYNWGCDQGLVLYLWILGRVREFIIFTQFCYFHTINLFVCPFPNVNVNELYSGGFNYPWTWKSRKLSVKGSTPTPPFC